MQLIQTGRRAATMAALLIAALATLVLVDGSPAWAAAKLTVSKTTGLTDGAQITVSGNGFTPNMNTIAVGQCIKEVAGPSDCNLAGGSQFVNANAQGKFGPITIKVAKKFGSFDCTKRQCVIAAQILPSAGDAATVAANKTSVNISFGTSSGGGGGGSTSQPTLPVTGPSTFQYVLILAGTGLLLPGIGLLLWLPRRRARAAA